MCWIYVLAPNIISLPFQKVQSNTSLPLNYFVSIWTLVYRGRPTSIPLYPKPANGRTFSNNWGQQASSLPIILLFDLRQQECPHTLRGAAINNETVKVPLNGPVQQKKTVNELGRRNQHTSLLAGHGQWAPRGWEMGRGIPSPSEYGAGEAL